MDESISPPRDDRPNTQRPLSGVLRSVGRIGPSHALVFVLLVAGVLGLSEAGASQAGAIDVEAIDSNSPVAEGEQLIVRARLVCDVLEFGCGQTVRLVVGQVVRDSRFIELGSREETVVDFSWVPGSDDAGDYVATVVPEEGRSAETEVTVIEPANFVVEVESTTSPVPAGEPLNVTATVTNTGDVAGTRTVDLSVDGAVEDSTTVTLDEGESRTVTLIWQTGPDDVGGHAASVRSPDDSAVTNVSVLAPPDFRVEIETASPSVPAGESLEITATITNTGDESATQDIELVVDGTVEDSTTVTLFGDESRTVMFTWQTGPDERGDHTVSVESDDTFDRTTVSVVEPANFVVGVESTTSPVAPGESLEVTATVTNTGDVAGTRTVDLVVDGTVEDSTTVTLDGDGSRTVTFTWQTGPDDVGRHTASVRNPDDSAVTDVGVLAPPDFRVEIGSAPSSVTAGGSLEITATVTNTGDEPATQDIELEIDGVVEDSTPVTLAGGGSRMVTLSWQTGEGDAGTYDITVSSDDSSDTVEVTVAEPANFSVTIDSENDTVTEGESTEITATVTNTGDESATREILLEVNGTEVDRTEVTLAGGDSQSVTLTWQTGSGDAGRKHIVSVLSSDDDDWREFAVEESTIIEVGEVDLPPEAVVGTGVFLGLLWLVKRDVAGGIVSGIKKTIQKRLNGNGEDGDDDGEDGRPRADITVVPTDPAPFRPVLIDGSLSYDPDPRDRIVSYSWTVGNREESDRRFVHVFTEAGDQEITLEVRNQRGEIGQDTETVAVEEKEGELELTDAHPDAPGRDHADLSEEYLVFANTGNEALELDGWTVHDAAEEEGRVAKGEHTFEFGEGLELAPEATVSIHTGEKPEGWAESEGEPRERHLFWGRSWPVWNNDEDIVVVQDAEETPVLTRRYERRDDQYVVEALDESTLVDWFRVPEAEDIDAVRR